MRYFVYCRKSQDAEDRQTLSIPAQHDEAMRLLGSRSDVHLVEVLEEKMSAKQPGRPVFNAMMKRIERGEADGIVSWHPDRLARNSVDGGLIIYLLDRGLLKDLKFASFSFDNSSQGKFMLQIMFGYSKYYVDSLSENVKRGNRAKVAQGWRPNQAPLGYLNDKATKTIVADPVHFPLIRRIFDLMLTGAYSPMEIARMARDDWGFRTPQRKRIGGTPLAMSTIYHILGNEFYAGYIKWQGELHVGKHKPVVNLGEFELVRKMLAKTNTRRPHTHQFSYTGMIRCSCGLGVTAEHKQNRYSYRYIYYHCSRRRLPPKCYEPAIELVPLEAQICAFISAITIDAAFERLIANTLRLEAQPMTDQRQKEVAALRDNKAQIAAEQSELMGLRLRHLITDAEYATQRERLQREVLRLNETIDALGNGSANCIEPCEAVLAFRKYALSWFERGDDTIRRIILETVASNLVLTSKTLSIDAVKPFVLPLDFDTVLSRLADNEHVRINSASRSATIAKELYASVQALDPTARDKIVRNVRMLEARFKKKRLLKKAA